MSHLYEVFAESAKRHASNHAIGFFEGEKIVHWTYRELKARIDAFADSMSPLNLQRGDRVALLSENHPLWPVVDLAVAKRGLVLVPIHTVLTVGQIGKILRQSRAKAFFLGHGIEDKIPALLEELPTEISSLIFFEESTQPSSTRSGRRLTSIPDLLRQGALENDKQATISGDEISTIIFTSGTTGEMKGVLLSHQGLVNSIKYGNEPVGASGDRAILSVLPLSHAFERNAGLLGPLMVGTTIYYGRGIPRLVDDIQVFQPDRLNAVPRLLEKIENGVKDKMSQQSGFLFRVFSSLLEQSRALHRGRALGNSIAWRHFPADRLAESVFYKKIRKKFGGNLKRIICGGAPIDPSVVEFFQAIGIQVLQGYGLTEVSPTVSVNPHDRNKIGTVGLPLSCVQVRLEPNGELCVKGSSLMLGYDDEKATAEAVDSEGWFHTGDQAEIDAEGYLTIKGRIKEMIVTSYGKNVIPSIVEQALEKNPLILQAVVFGHGKAYLSALLVPNREFAMELFQGNVLDEESWQEFCQGPQLREKMESALQLAQASLPAYEQVKRFEIVAEEFSQANDLLTPTLKVKRNKVAARYEREIQSMYSAK